MGAGTFASRTAAAAAAAQGDNIHAPLASTKVARVLVLIVTAVQQYMNE